MLLIAGRLLSNLGRPKICCIASISTLSRRQNLGRNFLFAKNKTPLDSGVKQRNLFDWAKKVKVGWILGPPPRPGTKEHFMWCVDIATLISAFGLIFLFCMHMTGNATLKKDFLKTGLDQATKMKQEEEELYQKTLALAKKRMEEIPASPTPQQ